MSPVFRPASRRLRVSLAANVVLAAGFQRMPFDTVDFEEGGGWDGIDTYVCPDPGLYLVGGQVRRDAVASSSNVFVRIMRNGAQEVGFPELSTTAAQVAAVSTLVQAEAMDTLQLEVRLHTTLSATATAGTCFFWLARIGPKRWT